MEPRSLPALLSGWNPNPFPNLSLSAAGLLVLADLHTIAQRTAITGGSTWLDALVLAPGLHYQQAADALDREGGSGAGGGLFAELVRVNSNSRDQDGQSIRAADRNNDKDVERGAGFVAEVGTRKMDGERGVMREGSEKYAINNAATLNYLRRLGKDRGRDVVTLDVRSLVAAKKAGYSLSRSMSDLLRRTSKAVAEGEESKLEATVSGLSHFLFLASPVFTIISIALTILLGDWWCLSIIIALMVSRLLNIWAIKQRSRSADPKTPGSNKQDGDDTADKPTEYTIQLGNGKKVVLKGTEQDLQAVTTQAWMRNKTNVEGYLEAAAKLLVYLVAAFSGNMSQAGSLILMALLLLSAACLGLSNAQAQGFKMHGRVARPEKSQADRNGSKDVKNGKPVIDGKKAIRLSEEHQAEMEERRRLEEQDRMVEEAGREVRSVPINELPRGARRLMYSTAPRK